MKQTRRKRRELKERAKRRYDHEFREAWIKLMGIPFIAGGGAMTLDDGTIVYLKMRTDR